MPLTNWAGNLTYGAQKLVCPHSVEELQQVAADSKKLRVLGSKHSFNTIADTPNRLVSLEHLPRPMALSADRSTVTVHGAARYGELSRFLESQGVALRNMASLPHISVAGACATATHGSGIANQALSSSVTAMEMVTAEGNLVQVSRQSHGEQFQGMVVHLGSLGIVTSVTLDIVPTYQIAQSVYLDLPLASLKSHFDEIMASGYSVSLFTTWQPDRIDQVWVKRRVDSGSSPAASQSFFGATPASVPCHPIGDVPAVSCTQQLGVPGPWHERLPHFRYEHVPSHGEELQTEYFVPREHALEALAAVRSLREKFAPLLLISEIRAIASDMLWMSPFYQRDSIGIHFTWKPDQASVTALLPLIEERLAPFHPRPHWAKIFTLPAEQVQASYERLPEFRELVREIDPTAKFRNNFIASILG